MVNKEDLMKLTLNQLKEIVKEVKEKLNLNVSQAKKEIVVDTLINLHKGNKFFGKKLLSLDDSGHIKIPKRQQGFRTEKQKIFQEKKKEKAALKKRIEEKIADMKFQKTDKARLQRIAKKLEDLKEDDPKFKQKLNVIQAQQRGLRRREEKKIATLKDDIEILKGGIPKTFRKPPNF